MRPRNWFAQKRAEYADNLLAIRGWLRRADLTEMFGISTQQAANDIKSYMTERGDGAVSYNKSIKRYESGPSFKRLYEPSANRVALVFDRHGDLAGVLSDQMIELHQIDDRTPTDHTYRYEPNTWRSAMKIVRGYPDGR